MCELVSRGNFCTKNLGVVIITGVEKIGNRTLFVEYIYVNRILHIRFFLPVEKHCGKACGECGKVWVFNSYFDYLKGVQPVWKGHPNLRILVITGVSLHVTSIPARMLLEVKIREIVLVHRENVCQKRVVLRRGPYFL